MDLLQAHLSFLANHPFSVVFWSSLIWRRFRYGGAQALEIENVYEWPISAEPDR